MNYALTWAETELPDKWETSDIRLPRATVTSTRYEGRRADVHDRYAVLSKLWRAETEIYSTITQKMESRYFLEIIQLGEQAIPMILSDLEQVP